MTTHDKDKVIAAAKEAGFLYYGEFPNDYKCKIESLYALAFEDGRQAEREECAKYIENQSLPDAYSEPCLAEFAEAIRARGDSK